MDELDKKYENLKRALKDMRHVGVAFSGGVDSTLLLKVANDVLGKNAIAVIVRSAFFPNSEYEQAVQLCKDIGCQMLEREIDVLGDESISSNPSDRCYTCKKLLFTEMKSAAAAMGIHTIVDGTNVDDGDDYRPGLRALDELQVVSPLRDAGFTKSDIRALATRLGLPNANKPAMACLATRFPVGEKLTTGALSAVEMAEDFLREIGFEQVRVRSHGDLARIEVDPNDLPKIVDTNVRPKVIERLTEYGFRYITVDISGYKMGSMNS